MAEQISTRMERLLAVGQELASLGTWELDFRTGETLWSDGMYRILGIEPELAGRDEEKILQVVHPDDRARMAEMLRTVAETPDAIPPEGLTLELRLVRGDGSIREVRAHGQVERENGTPARWLGVVQDITEQRLTERELNAHDAVSQTLREWDSLDEGTVALVERVGTALDYPMGSLWLWNEEEGALRCRAFWSAEGVDPGYFEHAKRSLSFRPNSGKPGLAWAKHEPIVTADTATDPVFEPREEAVAHGVKSTVAFPAVGDGGPVAVLSFYGFEHRLLSPSLVRTLTAIGHELGSFLSRRQVELGTSPLTQRELEVLRLAAEGNNGPDIARHLFLSPATVKTHFENIYEKLGVCDRAAAVAYALRTGLIR
jgi:PAS domain S-box-containing protein